MPGAEKQESPVLVVERSNSFSQLKLLRSGLKQWLMLECSNNNPNCTQSLQSSNCAKQIYNFKIQDTGPEEFVFYINITMEDKAGTELHDTALQIQHIDMKHGAVERKHTGIPNTHWLTQNKQF